LFILKSVKKIFIGLIVFVIFIVFAIHSLKPAVQKASAAPPPIPNPMILAYGGYDKGFDPTMLNLESSIPTPNVFESRVSMGYSQEAKEGVKILTEKGVLCAFHTTALPRTSHTYWWNDLNCANNSANFEACVQYNVDLWENAFTNELDGNLPGGYQALTVDEINMNDNTSLGAKIKHETLKRVKNNNPDRLIFVWVHHGNPVASVLNKIYLYADRLIVEQYLTEGDSISNVGIRALAMKSVCQGQTCDGILSKTVIGLGTADTEDHAYDRNPAIDFPDFLDRQLHYIKNHSTLKNLPGVAFYNYARTRPETIAWINKLTRHYYLNNQTSYLGDGNDSLSFISNQSFESSGGWSLQAGSGGQVTYKTVSDAGITNLGGKYRVPHGSRVLYMKTGSSPNKVTQTVSVSALNFYHLDVYAKKQTSTYEMVHADVQVTDSVGNSLITFKEKKEVIACANLSGVTCSDKNHRWTRFRIEFKTPSEVSTVKIVLSDNQAVPGEVTLWDFVELEELKAGSLTAGVGTSIASGEQPNLLGNPGFETGDFSTWYPWPLGGGEISVCSTVECKRSGNYGAQIKTNAADGRGGIDKRNHPIAVNPGEKYIFSAWIKTENIGYARLVLKFKDASGSFMESDKISGEVIPANRDWQEYILEGVVPSGAVNIVPTLYAHGAEGKIESAYFDDTSLVKPNLAGTVDWVALLKNPGFEEETLFWRESQNYGNTLNGQIVSNPVKEGAKSLMAQTNIGTNVWKQNIFLQNPLTYKISGWVYIEEITEGNNARIYVRADKNEGGYTDFNVNADSSKAGEWQYISIWLGI